MRRIVQRRGPTCLKTAARLGCLLLCLLVACSRAATPSGQTGQINPILATSTPSSPATAPVTATNTATITIPAPTGLSPLPTPSPNALPADFWQELPVIPGQISSRVREIYQNGLAMGNNPHVFSRIGDCASAAPAFLVGFAGHYNLGAYTALQPAIDYFQASFGRPSLAAKAGMNSAGLLTTLWTGKQCLANESLLDCQYRLDRPGFAIIAIGTNEAYYVHENPGSFEHNMRIILDDTIAKGIVPILSTKADDVEGDGSINATIARLAMEYQIPLWNFWLAAQPLPKHGMVDPEHLDSVSYANFTDFSIPDSLEYGVQMHNLTALQMLDFLRQQLAGNPAVENAPATP
ncbi:MAG: hypothetical protein ABSA23_08040 [Anaerolineales bacterium]|jgi:hypothetical protein